MRACIVIVALLAPFAIVNAGERRAAAPAQTKCPISGKPVDGKHFADVDGFRIYTAGPAEADRVRRDPGKAFGALAKNREAAEPVVWICPSMKREVSRAFPYVQQAGKRIYYCCAPCQPWIRKNFKQAADELKRQAERGS